MIIVAGHITTKPGKRDAFVAGSRAAIVAARKADGCHEFFVAADPVDPDRVCVYEAWDNEEALLAFRGDGPGDDLSALVAGAKVKRHTVSGSGLA